MIFEQRATNQTSIIGNKYYFRIINETFDDGVCFWTLRAVCKKSKKYSGINNLNSVLGQLIGDEGLDDVTGKYEDSLAWEVTKKEMKKFNRIAKSLVTSDSFLKYLEDKLGDDRSKGEWENVEL